MHNLYLQSNLFKIAAYIIYVFGFLIKIKVIEEIFDLETINPTWLAIGFLSEIFVFILFRKCWEKSYLSFEEETEEEFMKGLVNKVKNELKKDISFSKYFL